MLELALRSRVGSHRTLKAFPFEDDVPGFAGYLRDERGLKEESIRQYVHHLNGFTTFLKRINSESVSTFSAALLAAFIVDRCPGLARSSRRDLCGTLRVFLRYCYLPFIEQTLKQLPNLTASRLHAMVVERGYGGRPDHFRHIIARHRPRAPAQAYLRLRTLPGEQCQCD